MSLKESSGKLITPCYDGHILTGVQQVAGDGLSLVSIKQSHRNCKFTTDPNSKQLLLSCAQGTKARNSFWNLHKPDLRKVKGLECATTESVTQLFRAHNVANAGKPTYKRKMLRLLESLVNKKSKNPPQPLVQAQEEKLPENVCVLSSVCQEKEMKITSMTSEERFSSASHLTHLKPSAKILMEEKIISVNNSIKDTSTSKSGQSNKEAVYISLPSPDLLTLSSDNTLVGVGVHSLILDASNGDTNNKEQQRFVPFTAQVCEETNTTERTNSFIGLTEPSGLELKSKESLLHISTSSNQNYSGENTTTVNLKTTDDSDTNVKIVTRSKEVDVITENKTVQETEVKDKSSGVKLDENDETPFSDEPSENLNDLKRDSSKVVRSLFTEMFKEMQEIEDYIKSYSKSFYTKEEEFENHPVIGTMSFEVVSHFFEHQRSFKVSTDFDNNESSSLRNTKYNTNAGATGFLKTNNAIEFSKSSFSVCVENEDNNSCKHLEKKSEKDTQTKENRNILDSVHTRKLYETNVTENTKSSQDNHTGYCYWEDIDETPDSFIRDNLLEKNHSNRMQLPLIDNTAVISASFFENFWREFSHILDTGDYYFIDLIDEQLNSPPPSPNLSSFPGKWKNKKNQWKLIEAENIIDSMENFFSECFPYHENCSFTQSCTIEEIVDGFQKVNNDIKKTKSSSKMWNSSSNDEDDESKLPNIRTFGYSQNCTEQSSNESRLNDGTFIGDYQSRQNYLMQNFPSNENFTGSLEFGFELHTSSSHENVLSLPRKSLNQIIEECSTSSLPEKFEAEIRTPEMKTALMELESPFKFYPEAKKDFVHFTNHKVRSNLNVVDKKAHTIENINSFCCHPLETDLEQVFKSCTDVFSDEFVLSRSNLSRDVSNISLTNNDIETNSPSELKRENINTGRSRFVLIPNTSEETSSETNSQLLFSSPNVQLNLTNPFLNANKK